MTTTGDGAAWRGSLLELLADLAPSTPPAPIGTTPPTGGDA